MPDPFPQPSASRRRRRVACPARRAVLAAALAGAALSTLVAPRPAAAQHYVATSDTAHPLVRYADSTVSMNDRCIVRQTKLGYRVPPVYVNGLPIGFC